MLIIIFVCSIISLAFIIYSVEIYYLNSRRHINRIKSYINIQEKRTKKEVKTFKAGLSFIGNAVSKVSIMSSYKIKIQKELIRAHILLKGEEFITISIICAVLAVGLFGLLFRNIFIGLPFCILGWMIPSLILKTKKKKRVSMLNNQLADAIVLISNSLKAGYSFFQAVDMVAKEMSPPIGEEFLQLQKEINLGYTTEQALENLGNRIESDDLGLVITAVLIQRQVGGNLAEILDNISGTIRDRIKIKGEIRTLTAQGRISGIIISLVPVGLGVILGITNPEYIGLLFKETLGICILVIAVVMQIVGIYSINKIIKIDV